MWFSAASGAHGSVSAHWTQMKTLLEAIAFLLEIQSAVGLFLLLLEFHFQLRGNKSPLQSGSFFK